MISYEQLARASMLAATSRWLPDLVAREANSSTVRDVMSGFDAAAAQARLESTPDSAVRTAAAAWSARLDSKCQIRSTSPAERELFVAMIQDLGRISAADPLPDVFAVIAGGAATLYEDNWLNPGDLNQTFYAQYPEVDRYGVRAVTVEVGPARGVKLQIFVDRFGPEALAATPCALAHECVCHVASKPLGVVDNESVFAEGFMDWAATYWLKCWAADLPLGLDTMAVDHEPLFRAVVLAGSSEESLIRQAGRRAANHLARLLQIHHGLSQPKAHSRVASFAVRLNVVDASLVEKDDFVDSIETDVDAPIGEPLLGALLGVHAPGDVL